MDMCLPGLWHRHRTEQHLHISAFVNNTTEQGELHEAQSISIVPGSPSVFFRRQLCHILRCMSFRSIPSVGWLTVEVSILDKYCMFERAGQPKLT